MSDLYYDPVLGVVDADKKPKTIKAADAKHYPRGRMCVKCVNFNKDCSHLNFESMRLLEIYRGDFIVKCSSFIRGIER